MKSYEIIWNHDVSYTWQICDRSDVRFLRLNPPWRAGKCDQITHSNAMSWWTFEHDPARPSTTQHDPAEGKGGHNRSGCVEGIKTSRCIKKISWAARKHHCWGQNLFANKVFIHSWGIMDTENKFKQPVLRNICSANAHGASMRNIGKPCHILESKVAATRWLWNHARQQDGRTTRIGKTPRSNDCGWSWFPNFFWVSRYHIIASLQLVGSKLFQSWTHCLQHCGRHSWSFAPASDQVNRQEHWNA